MIFIGKYVECLQEETKYGVLFNVTVQLEWFYWSGLFIHTR